MSLTSDADEVAEALRGQCLKGFEQVCEDLDVEDSVALRHAVDGLVFECKICNWWFEQSEMSETHDWVCESCGEDEDDDADE